MTSYIALEDTVEVSGEAVLALVNGMAHLRDKALAILAANGIDAPQSSHWYPQQNYLNAFADIARDMGPHSLYAIGTTIPETASFPPGIHSLAEALAVIDVAYHMNHRGGEIGHYRFAQESDGSMHFRSTTPYPCEFDRGIIEGMARRFVPAGAFIVVRHEDDGPCREKNGSSCTYSIEIIKKNNSTAA